MLALALVAAFVAAEPEADPYRGYGGYGGYRGGFGGYRGGYGGGYRGGYGGGYGYRGYRGKRETEEKKAEVKKTEDKTEVAKDTIEIQPLVHAIPSLALPHSVLEPEVYPSQFITPYAVPVEGEPAHFILKREAEPYRGYGGYGGYRGGYGGYRGGYGGYRGGYGGYRGGYGGRFYG